MTRKRGPWCTLCGWLAVELAASIDPGRPIVRCIRGHHDTGRHTLTPDRRPKATCLCGALDSAGCGRAIGTRNEAEAQAVYTARERRLATAHHGEHLRRKVANPLCRVCQEAEPAELPM